jgi:hypothetical protein
MTFLRKFSKITKQRVERSNSVIFFYVGSSPQGLSVVLHSARMKQSDLKNPSRRIPKE